MKQGIDKMKIISRITALALTFSTAAPTTFAAVQPVAVATSSNIALEAGSGRVVRIKGRISSLFAADPKIVEVRPAGPNSVFLFGVGVGRSTVAALDQAGNPLQQFDVLVRPSSFGADEAAAASQRAVPGSDTQFSSTANGITITGRQASPAAAEQEAAIASGYISDKQAIDDHSTINSGVQVTLRVRIAEISRTITRQFGINWTALANFGRWGIAGVVSDGLSQASNPPNTIGVGYKSGSASINTVLDLLAQDQLITMLAEPNLTARSGETASFLAGGEFPVPIAGSNGQITVAFKQYGVSLAFVPTVLTDGRISLHVRPEVSQLSSAGAVSVPIGSSLFGSSTVTIPATTVRRADTTVELGSGQSFAIAGLLTANSAMDARGTPFIDELPVIGPLFKSDLFQRDESELVIVITPYIVKPVSQANLIGAPTDGFVPAADADRLLRYRQRASGTDPVTVVAPSAAALAQASTAQASNTRPAGLPAGTGFILH
jgi:pilus assembly protein CpaC